MGQIHGTNGAFLASVSGDVNTYSAMQTHSESRMFTKVSQYSSVCRYSGVVLVSMENLTWINRVHASVTLTCSNDVEMNPGPGQSDDKGPAASIRRKQAKLSTTEKGDMTLR